MGLKDRTEGSVLVMMSDLSIDSYILLKKHFKREVELNLYEKKNVLAGKTRFCCTYLYDEATPGAVRACA